MTPKYLYKYKPIPLGKKQKKWLEDLLINNKIYFPSPIDLNDPFDLHSVPKLLNDEKIIREILEKLIYPSFKNDGHAHTVAKIRAKKEVDNLFAQNKSASPLEIYEPVFRESMRKYFGILCLTSIPDSIPMYSYYADGHRGFCIQFDTTRSNFFKDVKKVKYENKYPIINFSTSLPIKQDALLTKSKCWAHENEYRIVLSDENPARGHFKILPEQSLSGIIFGCQISENDKNYLKSIFSRRKSPIKIYQAKICDGEYKLKIIEDGK